MSLEAWGDEGDTVPDGYVTEERAEEAFVLGAQACREMMARFVESESKAIAASIRANWHPSWGEDPGKLEGEIPPNCWA